jgi:hypothetical protein
MSAVLFGRFEGIKAVGISLPSVQVGVGSASPWKQLQPHQLGLPKSASKRTGHSGSAFSLVVSRIGQRSKEQTLQRTKSPVPAHVYILALTLGNPVREAALRPIVPFLDKF